MISQVPPMGKSWETPQSREDSDQILWPVAACPTSREVVDYPYRCLEETMHLYLYVLICINMYQYVYQYVYQYA